MKFTNLFLTAGTLLFAASLSALDITVNNATNEPLKINKEADLTVSGDTNGTIPPGQKATFTVIRVGGVDPNRCTVTSPVNPLENVELSVANKDNYFWDTYIKAGSTEYFFTYMTDASITVHSNSDVTLDNHNLEAAKHRCQ